ncbi:hypothetical protein ALC53_02025 [Atta colombica]|uniref:Uncharacterized protein n=1 Tax=Atta colombica TaxID=520822 RepID=A0A195BSR6_9HYME|nr:hypothetical protein ALC53_02025 [Atta colombica]
MPKRMARWLLSDMKILELPSSSSHPTADVSCDFPSSSIDHPSLVFARRFSYRRPWRKLMHSDISREADSFSNQCRSICSSQWTSDSDGISGELVSAKVGDNFTAAAVLCSLCFSSNLLLDPTVSYFAQSQPTSDKYPPMSFIKETRKDNAPGNTGREGHDYPLLFLPTGCRGVTSDGIYEAARKATDEI